MPTARAMWRSDETARMRRPVCVRSSRNQTAATRTLPTTTMASGWRPSATPAISNEPLPASAGAVRGAAPRPTVRPCSMMAASAMVATKVASGGRAASGRIATRAATMPAAPSVKATSGNSNGRGKAGRLSGDHGDGAAQHDKIAVCEVDRAGGVQGENEAQRHQRIGHAQRRGVEQELNGDQCSRISVRGGRACPGSAARCADAC